MNTRKSMCIREVGTPRRDTEEVSQSDKDVKLSYSVLFFDRRMIQAG